MTGRQGIGLREEQLPHRILSGHEENEEERKEKEKMFSKASSPEFLVRSKVVVHREEKNDRLKNQKV